MTAVLEAGQQLQRLSWRSHEATKLAQCDLASRINVTKDQLLGEGRYADLKEQIEFDDSVIEQCCSFKSLEWG